MKHRIYYDAGFGQAAMIVAGMRLGLLPTDRLPSCADLATFFQDRGQGHPLGRVVLLGETEEEKVFWCGLGRSTVVAVRAWRHFLQLYREPQTDYAFQWVPKPSVRKWRQGERLLRRGRLERGRKRIAEAAVREYAVFLTAWLTELKESKRKG